MKNLIALLLVLILTDFAAAQSSLTSVPYTKDTLIHHLSLKDKKNVFCKILEESASSFFVMDTSLQKREIRKTNIKTDRILLKGDCAVLDLLNGTDLTGKITRIDLKNIQVVNIFGDTLSISFSIISNIRDIDCPYSFTKLEKEQKATKPDSKHSGIEYKQNHPQNTVVDSDVNPKTEKALKATVPNQDFSINPHIRYLFTQNAIPYKNRKGYYQNTLILYNGFQFGVGKNVSFGFGIMPVYTQVNLKISKSISEKRHFGFAAYSLFSLREISNGLKSFTGGEFIYTIGDTRSNLTLGAGYSVLTKNEYRYYSLYTHNLNSETYYSPLLSFSGVLSITDVFSLCTENHMLLQGNGSDFLMSYGMRFHWKRCQLDIMAINSKEIAEEILIGIPTISFTRNF